MSGFRAITRIRVGWFLYWKIVFEDGSVDVVPDLRSEREYPFEAS